MCGRFQLSSEENLEELVSSLKKLDQQTIGTFKVGEVFPSQSILCINHQLRYDVMHWGFRVPFRKSLIINSRSETIEKLPLFAKEFAATRCIIISTGFYEWNKKREKFLINQTNSNFLYMAGIYRMTEKGKEISIITQQANHELSIIHPRMPVILQKNEIKSYLIDKEIARAIVCEKKIFTLKIKKMQ